MPFIELGDIESRELIDGFQVRFVHTDAMTFAYWEIKAGALLPEHAHEHEQVAHDLAGEFELTIHGETQVVRPGTVGVIPAHAIHSGKAITDCRVMDVFYPIREDYR